MDLLLGHDGLLYYICFISFRHREGSVRDSFGSSCVRGLSRLRVEVGEVALVVGEVP